VLVGTVHSGVVMALVQASRERGIPLVIPNAGNVAATRELCSSMVFRSSFSNWQPAYAAGLALGRQRVRRAAWMTWDYAAGNEAGEGFRQGLSAAGGQLVRELKLPFPRPTSSRCSPSCPASTSRRWAASTPAAARCSSCANTPPRASRSASRSPAPASSRGHAAGPRAGGGGHPHRAALRRRARQPEEQRLPPGLPGRANRDADVYAVQGYDAAQILDAGLTAARGDVTAEQAFVRGVRAARIDSPRGAFTLSPSHNPVQNMYLREARGGENRVIGIAAEALADPGTGCRMS
jgi:branched-chain amino acid transport system substrate-binding protein